MANLVANGSAWSPSGLWDGTKFTFISTGENDTITYGGTIVTGDTVSFSIAVIAIEFGNPAIRIEQGSTEIVLLGTSFGAPLPTSYTSPPLNASAGALTITVEANYGLYSHEITLTPIGGAPVPCFWTDLVNVTQDCETT